MQDLGMICFYATLKFQTKRKTARVTNTFVSVLETKFSQPCCIFYDALNILFLAANAT